MSEKRFYIALVAAILIGTGIYCAVVVSRANEWKNSQTHDTNKPVTDSVS